MHENDIFMYQKRATLSLEFVCFCVFARWMDYVFSE